MGFIPKNLSSAYSTVIRPTIIITPYRRRKLAESSNVPSGSLCIKLFSRLLQRHSLSISSSDVKYETHITVAGGTPLNVETDMFSIILFLRSLKIMLLLNILRLWMVTYKYKKTVNSNKPTGSDLSKLLLKSLKSKQQKSYAARS